MRQIKLVCVGVLSALLAAPCVAFAQPYDKGRADWREENLVGRWYSNGEGQKPVEIHSSRRGLQARNEHGDSSRLETRGSNAVETECGRRSFLHRSVVWPAGDDHSAGAIGTKHGAQFHAENIVHVVTRDTVQFRREQV